MQLTVSHSFQEETSEAKARWFQSLSLRERMELLCTYTDLFMAVNPKIVDTKDGAPLRIGTLFIY